MFVISRTTSVDYNPVSGVAREKFNGAGTTETSASYEWPSLAACPRMWARKVEAMLSIDSGTNVPESDVIYARIAGLCVHHEFETRTVYPSDDDEGEPYDEVLRDDWYVAPPEWVEQYHRSGGTWY